MAGKVDAYSGPIFSIKIVKSAENSPDEYQWTLKMSADDWNKKKNLAIKQQVSFH